VANSVALGDNRILWVFGDTLLAEPGVNSCDRFDQFDIRVHNSLAIQVGTDPTTASISHFWRQQSGEPASFFAPQHDSDSWYWMGGATVFEGQVMVFLMHARATTKDPVESGAATSCAGLNFEMVGWDARIAKITPQGPDQWQWREVSLPDDVNWHNILVGSSTISVDENYLYAWSAGPASPLLGNPVFLARWPLAAAEKAEMDKPQWYTDAGWKMQSVLGEDKPTAIVVDGNNEISVGENLIPNAAQPWWWLQSSYIVNSPLCYRSGDSPTDMGECHVFMEPPELGKYPDSSLLVYAVKFHPALTGQGDDTVTATYVVNSCNLKDIQEKCDLYYPRFIKLQVSE
jgi:hypothetical protein